MVIVCQKTTVQLKKKTKKPQLLLVLSSIEARNYENEYKTYSLSLLRASVVANLADLIIAESGWNL